MEIPPTHPRRATVTAHFDGTPPNAVDIIVINPNSNRDMSVGIGLALEDQLGSDDVVQITTFTASSGPSSIDNLEDALISTRVISSNIDDIPLYFGSKDAIVIACYSPHPLVSVLRNRFASLHKPVVGIFEASISLAVNILPVGVPEYCVNLHPTANPACPARKFTGTKFGIVTTGASWVPALTSGVNEYLGLSASNTSQSTKFKGVESTGLSAEQLHSSPTEEVKERLIGATRRLLADGDVAVVVLGCAGMSGMDRWVEEACIIELGIEAASLVRIVDGVKAAVVLALEEVKHLRYMENRKKALADGSKNTHPPPSLTSAKDEAYTQPTD